MSTFKQAFKAAPYKVNGHGPLTVGALQTALASMDPDTPADHYGSGAIIEEFQQQMAAFVGKEAAVFFPSGTMAQQIVLRMWCDEQHCPTVAYHPLSHLEMYEEKGLHTLHPINVLTLGDSDRLFTLEDVKNLHERVACILVELPQRDLGGELPSLAELRALSSYCKEHNIKLHLDGARLFEVLPYYDVSAPKICELFDSVYLSFYKGLGGVAGAVLAGDAEFMKPAKVWKRRYGGDLISLYPYIVSASDSFTLRLPRMKQYYEQAQQLASNYNACPLLSTRPVVPVCNMFHVHIDLPKETVETILIAVMQETGIALTGHVNAVSDTTSFFEVTSGDLYPTVPQDKLAHAFASLTQHLQGGVLHGNESHQ
ncbi:aromatic amino acid beta-eliminating lyase/threonine aldolase [Fictibacillus macauensis ZFHKF-1]|uniref:Aromatic amino acid beta-eliminating lyase/threonine aldolase n=1 Tax=Fictibacillus macauensis ZFHKF-1 TaxID=1196324 RepID=I8UC69_9BACL|nr:aminotransferase class I/II-fold pyridoxal phosphate-dependent enzyme [Fictibacillus macauensis]EIT84388.1 aromatic amino acid beta-eliminating lyase/threonine aldolase [Fictibacillus macauensis ZFHKF-1]